MVNVEAAGQESAVETSIVFETDPSGTTAWISVRLIICTSVAATDPNFTVEPGVKPLPVIVTKVPAGPPDAGESEVISATG